MYEAGNLRFLVRGARGGARLLVALLVILHGCGESRRQIKLGVTTSVRDSGMLDALSAEFLSAQTDYALTVIASGSGQVLGMAARGDLDVVIAHSPEAELEFMTQGHGELRRPVMVNDFVIVGPPSDPAAVLGTGDAAAAIVKVAASRAPFMSRGDDSGTHRKELELWSAIGGRPDWPGYKELGQGMAAVLQAASETSSYTLTDRGTYLSVRGGLDLVVVSEGDERLVNRYSVIVVNGARNADGARAFAGWLTSKRGQAAIGRFGVDEFGMPLFRPVGETAQ